MPVNHMNNDSRMLCPGMNPAVVILYLAGWTLCLVCLVYLLTGRPLSPGVLVDFIPGVFLILPLVVLIKPDYLGYLLIIFLPFQQILLCIAYTNNPMWGYAMKWILGWKDYCLFIALATVFLKYRTRMLPEDTWEYCLLIYLCYSLLTVLMSGYPLMSRIASLRFNIAPFLFLVCGFYTTMSTRQIQVLVKLFFCIASVSVIYGVAEVFLLSEEFFLEYIDIGGFKSGVHETGAVKHIGTYLYAPGFLHKRRMVSIFLASPASGHFLSFGLCFILACQYAKVGFQSQMVSFCLIILIILGILLTVNRLSILEALCIGIYYTYKSDLKTKLQYGLSGALAVTGILAFYWNTVIKVVSLTISVNDPSANKHFHAIIDAPTDLLGKGLGAAANVFASTDNYAGATSEGIFNRMLIEVGVAGFVLFLVVYAAIICNAAGADKIHKTSYEGRLAQAICSMGAVYAIVMIPSIFITVNLFSSVSHGFFWFILGIGFRLRRESFELSKKPDFFKEPGF